MIAQLDFTYTPSAIAEPVPVDLDCQHPSIRTFFLKNRLGSRRYVSDLPKRKHWLQRHSFHLSANLCMDGRVSDFGQAIDVPVGLLEMFRSAGSRSSIRNFMYAQRTHDAVVRSSAVHIDGRVHDLAEMRFVTAHCSESNPTTASCKAWEHRTDAALAAMQEHAHELNFCWKGRMVAFPTLIDTDWDAITLYGPEHRFSVRQLVEDLGPSAPSRRESIVEDLIKTFPMEWPPLAALKPTHRAVFHCELAERVEANLAFVRTVIASNRPIELLEHGERLIFIGRHADWIDEHNSVFIIDDTQERKHVMKSFQIALPYVAKNVIADAVAADDRDWVVPVVVNVPYDSPDEDRNVAVQYGRYLVEDIMETIQEGRVSMFGLFGPHGVKSETLPKWMIHQVTGLADRIRLVTSVSSRKTRLFEPVI